MPTSREILESTYRSGRIKKVRVFVYVAQVVLVIVLLVVLASFTEYASFSPLYLPFESFFFIIAALILAVNAESFFFRLFGMRYAKSDSERYLASKDYTKWCIALIIAAVAIIIIANALNPILDEGVDDSETVLVQDETVIEFPSQDPLAITGVKRITLTSDDGVPLDVYILREEDYKDGYYGRRLNPYPQDSQGITEMNFERDNYIPHGDYVLYINSSAPIAQVTYTLERDVSQTLVLYLTVFPGIFIGMNVVWIIYLWPLRKRYEKTSIYE